MSLPLYSREYGEAGPVILLLHGLFGSSANWGSVAKRLSSRYRLLVPDLRNHGQSPHHPDVSYPAMAADLLALLDEHERRRVVVVGHSMGGKLAMQLALRHPERVRALAVVDMAPVAYTHRFDHVFDGFEAVDLRHLRSRADADAQMAVHVPQAGVRAFLLQNLRQASEGWSWRCHLASLRQGQAQITGFDDPQGRVFHGPASFIHGSLSDYLLPEHWQAIHALFPAASICPVEGAGHWVYAENPAGFMHCLEAFLQAA